MKDKKESYCKGFIGLVFVFFFFRKQTKEAYLDVLKDNNCLFIWFKWSWKKFFTSPVEPFYRLLDFAIVEDELCMLESDKIFVEHALHVQLLG